MRRAPSGRRTSLASFSYRDLRVLPGMSASVHLSARMSITRPVTGLALPSKLQYQVPVNFGDVCVVATSACVLEKTAGQHALCLDEEELPQCHVAVPPLTTAAGKTAGQPPIPSFGTQHVPYMDMDFADDRADNPADPNVLGTNSTGRVR